MANEFTVLLRKFEVGDKKALEELAEIVYTELRQIARAYMKKERAAHTLQPTALVNEVFLRLFRGEEIDWESRSHFYSVAARMMRRILTDHARKRLAQRRGADPLQVSFEENLYSASNEDVDLIALNDALEALSKFDESLSKLVELRYFGGLSIEETAEVLQCSTGTVKRNWLKAKACLLREMKKSGAL